MRKIKDLLVNVYSLDLTGWTLDIAYGISGDGNIIVGIGRNPSGYYEAWQVNLEPEPIPEPATIALLGVAIAGISAVAVRRGVRMVRKKQLSMMNDKNVEN